MKTEAEYFADWEAHVFGYGYGTGEPFVLPALKSFFGAFEEDDSPNRYEYEQLEKAVTPAVAWLLINVLCHADVIEYGTSPRFGWLTPHGNRLKEFIDQHTSEQLVNIATGCDENYVCCYPDACNCGPNGYEKGRKCGNPFWLER